MRDFDLMSIVESGKYNPLTWIGDYVADILANDDDSYYIRDAPGAPMNDWKKVYG